MEKFDEREKSAEKKFAMDEEKAFKIDARRNKFLGQWASKILSFNADQEKEYIQSIIKADFAEAGDQDVFRKLKEDLKNHNIPDTEIRKKMNEFSEKSKSEFI
jgi:hypothetical protein